MDKNTHKEVMSMKLYPRFRGERLLSYYVRFDDGRIRSLKTCNKERAQRAFRKIERAYFQGKVAKLCGECTKRLGDYYDEYIKWADGVVKRSTFRANRLALDKIIAVAGRSIFIDMLSLRHIDLMVAAAIRSGVKPTSINVYIRHARAALNKAVEWEYVKENPLAKAKELPIKKKTPVYIKKSELAPFLATVKDVDLRRFITALVATGRRRSELVYLGWEDVDFINNTYTIRRSKSGYEYDYGINQLFKSVLLSIPGRAGRVFDRWKHPDTWSHMVKSALSAAGFGGCHLHHFRHSYAAMKAEEGRSILEIQRLLGHSDIKATAIYAHIGQDHQRDIGEVEIGPVSLGK